MEIFKQIEEYGHEKVLFGHDKDTGLKTIIAVHDTTLGPACGGTRFWNYDTEESALYDVLRLSRGMTLKNAAAGIALGGGKAVIIGDPAKLKSKEFFHAYGKVVDSLGGCYYTAEDVNIGATDIAMINEATRYVTGTPAISGNPSPFTAGGVYMGMKACAKAKYGSDSLAGKTIAVMGAGSVGYSLCQYVASEGAKLLVYDINKDAVAKAVAQLKATPVSTQEEIIAANCDIFAPCAMGAVLHIKNINALRCDIVCGAANNVLVDAATGQGLMEKGILYAPDYIVNAGGIINCSAEILGEYKVDVINKKVDDIYDTTLKIIGLADENKISTYAAADEYALGIIAKAKK